MTKKNKKFKSFFVFTLLFLLLSVHVNFFKSIYLLSFRGYDERMLRTYGFGCEIPNAYQFLKRRIDEDTREEKSFYIHNLYTSARYWYPSINSLFLNLKIDESKEHLILLNYHEEYHGLDLKNFNLDVNLNDYQKKPLGIPGCAYFIKK
ncbi:hypothetical protein [Candidatus Pelagibacter sp. Uisw_136]|uniref:hypothetical protein n=1 Tax=Candidatus Pelagibacter sp. Uisw_136 TaxID=3230991 RepID=UPI0039E9E18F